MAIQNIGLGTTADDGTGDTLRVAGEKINENFSELYERAPHPGFVSGLYYGAQRGGTVGGTTITANLHYAIPVFLPRDVVIQSILCRVSTGLAGNGLMGIYSNINGRPGALLAGSAAIDTTTASDKAGAISGNYTASAGWYWFTSLFSSAAGLNTITNTDTYNSWLIGTTLANQINVNSSGNFGVTGVATYSGGLPSSFGTATNITAGAPALGFRVA